MDPLWYDEFRSSPTSFLQKNRTNVEGLVHDLLQILYSDDKTITLKLNVLGILQEHGSFLLDDINRLELVLGTLKNIVKEQRNTAEPIYMSQVLVTITDLLLQTQFLESVQPYLIEFVSMLLEIIEKLKTETNRLLRSTACDCLKEIELSIPGLLCDIVGHLFGMCQAENSFIHQHYMGLFATALCHNVQKVAILPNTESNLPDDEGTVSSSLRDVLFHDGRRPQVFEPPPKYWKLSKYIAKMPLNDTIKVPDSTDQSELMKAISFLVDHCHLFTTHFMVQIILKVMRIILCSTLSPVMLKSLLLRYSCCYDIQLWNMMLLMKVLFTEGICDEKDELVILRRLIIMSGHPCLPSHQCAIAIQWLLQLKNDEPKQFLSEVDSYMLEPLQPVVFDADEIVWFKLLTLSGIYQDSSSDDIITGFKSVLGALQKPLLCGISGSPCRLLYRIMLLFFETFDDDMKKYIERVAVNILVAHAEFTPQSLDLMALVSKRMENETMSGNILSEVCQWLQTLEISELCLKLEYHLCLCTAAAKSKQVWPQIPLQILKKVIMDSSVCQEGDWDIGNAILLVLCTLMKVLPSDGTAAKDLANLLLTMSKSFMDIDIRDRARIYLQILLTVSNEKLSALLSESEISSDLSQAVDAGISNNVYPISSSVKTISSSVFILERADYCHNKWTSSCIDVEDYCQWIIEQPNLFVLHIPCIISLSKAKPDWVSNKVYAVVLQFSNSSSYIKPPDIRIPSISIGEEVSIIVDIKAVKPFPASFEIKGIFTNDDGETCTCPLEPIQIYFHELFHSPPLDNAKVSAKGLFNFLWAKIKNEEHSRSSPTKEGALSITRLELSYQKLHDLLVNKLTPYCPYLQPLKDEGSYEVLLFLPPRYHILLKCSSDDATSVVEIATDHWMLLPFVGEWLKNISS